MLLLRNREKDTATSSSRRSTSLPESVLRKSNLPVSAISHRQSYGGALYQGREQVER